MDTAIKTASLIEKLIAEAARKGLRQRDLAEKAGIAPETLSRLKKAGNPTLDVMVRLADAAGLDIELAPPGTSRPHAAPRQAFKDRYKTLAWSNTKASEQVLLTQALLKPQFHVLLDAALEYGVSRLQDEWRRIAAGGSEESRRAAPHVSRILRNIERGYYKAAA